MSLYVYFTNSYSLIEVSFQNTCMHFNISDITIMIELRNRFIQDVDLNEDTSLTHLLDRLDNIWRMMKMLKFR